MAEGEIAGWSLTSPTIAHEKTYWFLGVLVERTCLVSTRNVAKNK
jgi:hypothetical protein